MNFAAAIRKVALCAGAAVSCVASAYAQESHAVTRDNVELIGAGALDFSPDETALARTAPDNADGMLHPVKVWFDPMGKPLECAPAGAAPQPLHTELCRQLLSSARFIVREGFALPFDRGYVLVRPGVFRPPGKTGETPEVAVMPWPDLASTPVYPPLASHELQQLSRTDGETALAAMDYPAIALRLGLSGWAGVTLGIARDGRMTTCRPIESSGSAYLDNATCDLLLRHGRFEFVDAAPPYEGLRYLVMKLKWELPQ